MEKPLNIKQRKSSIIRFLFICLIALGLIFYHVMISLDFFYVSATLPEDDSVETTITGE